VPEQLHVGREALAQSVAEVPVLLLLLLLLQAASCCVGSCQIQPCHQSRPEHDSNRNNMHHLHAWHCNACGAGCLVEHWYDVLELRFAAARGTSLCFKCSATRQASSICQGTSGMHLCMPQLLTELEYAKMHARGLLAYTAGPWCGRVTRSIMTVTVLLCQ